MRLVALLTEVLRQRPSSLLQDRSARLAVSDACALQLKPTGLTFGRDGTADCLDWRHDLLQRDELAAQSTAVLAGAAAALSSTTPRKYDGQLWIELSRRDCANVRQATQHPSRSLRSCEAGQSSIPRLSFRKAMRDPWLVSACLRNALDPGINRLVFLLRALDGPADDRSARDCRSGRLC